MRARNQDGSAAGQSVPHVHIHILPRRTTDFGGNNDDVYPALERNEHELNAVLSDSSKHDDYDRKVLQIPKDEDRKVRTEDDMEREAQWLATFFAEGRDV
jgi:bis(5'-adenosyl)-triphosphatase